MNASRFFRFTGLLKRAAQASALFFVCALAACGSLPPAISSYGAAPSPIELVDTPFFPQQQFQCGPAALTTLLTASGVATTLDAIVAQVYLPARQGSLQSELLAATRAAGRVPYILTPALASITSELAAGRPVLVLQNLGVSWAPRWHYAVVIGADAERDEIVLRSGTDARRIMQTSVFLRTWQRSGYWALTALRPGELPAQTNRLSYIEAVAGLEQTGHYSEARDAWRAGLLRWPDDAVLLFGLANTEFALGNLIAAETLYKDMLRHDGASLVAHNNLAMTLAAQGRRQDALEQIDSALLIAAGSPMVDELRDTRASILVTAADTSYRH